jgi:uncharacterized protein
MVIALKEVLDEGIVQRAIILVVVPLLITAVVYGVVALIVKMDDIGLRMAQRDQPSSQRVGRLLVEGMPKLLAALSIIGTAAMLWVGGHILLVGADELGWHTPTNSSTTSSIGSKVCPASVEYLRGPSTPRSRRWSGLSVGALGVWIVSQVRSGDDHVPAGVH